MKKTYIAIDLKSFYASVECVVRGLDPMKSNLVVADESRTEKTICLAVTPPLKSIGIPGRARLFEVVEKVGTANRIRRNYAPSRAFSGSSTDAEELAAHPEYAIDYIVAPPRMAYYIDYSTRIYEIYLKYVSPEDIHVYSIDEVFIDATDYLRLYGISARALAFRMIRDVLRTTGITATAGIGENLYLCKVALDIHAKKVQPDKYGVRIAELTEQTYRELLWDHQPLTDFWRVGRGTAKKLESHGIYTMGDIALCSVGGRDDYYNEALLYKLFGVNAELLIDHAWGWEPCTIADIKSYRPESNSLNCGQVLSEPYSFEKSRLIVREMADLMSLDLAARGLVCDQIVLDVGYDIENLKSTEISKKYTGPVVTDHYGRSVPKGSHGSINLGSHTASTKQIMSAVDEVFCRIANRDLLVRRLTIAANHVLPEKMAPREMRSVQLDLFSDAEEIAKKEAEERRNKEREGRRQAALIGIKNRFGKNAIFRGMNLSDGATAIERNAQIGGHKA